MRIDSLSQNNEQTQGEQRRTWLRAHAPQHLEHCETLISRALRLRPSAASQSTLVLGAGACTEVPLLALCRASDEVVLADLDLAALQRAGAEVTAPMYRRRMLLVECDISGGVSKKLAHLLNKQPWDDLATQGAQAVFDAAAQCLEACLVSDPPVLPAVNPAGYGVVISSLVLSQLFSYPLLDVLDRVQSIAPAFLDAQERHRRYQEMAQQFRIRIINAHLHLLRSLLDVGGIAVLLSDMRGFAFTVYGTDHDAQHRRMLPLVPRVFPELVRDNFEIIEEIQWEWLSDLPGKDRPGRGYEVIGYILAAR
jgi:hypothetical protein